jgi:DNA-binding response OmpR family regulator
MASLAQCPTRVRPARIWIADLRRADYDCLVGKNAGNLEVRFLSSAHDVLHRWPTVPPDVCIVNVRLPGLSGFDLVEMLRPFPRGTTLGMVADAYSAEDEVHALSLGVHFFLCKPLTAEMLFAFCRKQRRAPQRRHADAFPHDGKEVLAPRD